MVRFDAMSFHKSGMEQRSLGLGSFEDDSVGLGRDLNGEAL